MKREARLMAMFEAMRDRLGPSHWWPGDTPFEIAVGAILTQNTAWTNVTKAIANLRTRDFLDPKRMLAMSETDLADCIRPSGSFQVKARRLRNFLFFLQERCDLDLDHLRTEDTATLRAALLQVSGIGPETADSILLYALGHPVFVVDAYTRRILNRHLLVPEDIGYDELQSYFTDVLPLDAALFNEYHALIVRVGKEWCAKKAGKCAACPLGPFLEYRAP